MEARLALTHWRPNFPPTGTHPSPRSASVSRSTTRSILWKSLRAPAPCIHWSMMGNTSAPHWVVTSGSPWLVLMLPCSSPVSGKASTQSVPWLHAPKQESVSLLTRTEIATLVTPGSGSALEANMMTLLNTCGNIAKTDAYNGNQLIKALGYVLVQWETSNQESLDYTLYLMSDLSSVSPLLYWPDTICENMFLYCTRLKKNFSQNRLPAHQKDFFGEKYLWRSLYKN